MADVALRLKRSFFTARFTSGRKSSVTSSAMANGKSAGSTKRTASTESPNRITK